MPAILPAIHQRPVSWAVQHIALGHDLERFHPAPAIGGRGRGQDEVWMQRHRLEEADGKMADNDVIPTQITQERDYSST